MTFLPRARKDGKRGDLAARVARTRTSAHSNQLNAIGNEAKPVSIRPQGPCAPLGPNGGEIAAARISTEEDRFVVLVLTVGHRREVYD
jgi:hypothetical protein